MTAICAVTLVGAAGRMGLEITRVAQGIDGVRIEAAVDRPGCPSLGRDIGELAGIGPTGVPIDSGLARAVERADVVVDLSLPEATRAVVSAAQAAQTPLVCGTTGLGAATLALFDAAARDIPVLYTSNLSPGIAVVTALVEQAVSALGDDYDIEVVEMHHRDKVDAPSGTALTIARAAARAAGRQPDDVLCFGRQGAAGPRPRAEIGVHAVRGGGVFGEHQVILANRHERVEIGHIASSRTLFAQGALRAARFLVDKPAGRYTMTEVLGLSPKNK